MPHGAAQPHARAWLAADEAVSPRIAPRSTARGLRVPSGVELHGRTNVHHGRDVKPSQPGVLHVETWSDFLQMLFYFSERGHPGPMSFSSSRMLNRKKPDKLG